MGGEDTDSGESESSLIIQVKVKNMNYDPQWFENITKSIESIVTSCSPDPRRNMHYIDPATVPEWIAAEEYWIPAVIDTTCSACHKAVSITLKLHYQCPNINSIGLKGNCPRCRDEKTVWITGIKVRKTYTEGNKCESIWLLPVPKTREPMATPEHLAVRTSDAYREAIKCFNAGFWRSSITECGRALEGIVKNKFSTEEKRRTLNDAINKVEKDLKETTKLSDLFTPIIELGHALRLGRNISSHLDLADNPDRETAEEIIDLAEFLIKYFYRTHLTFNWVPTY